MLEPPFTPNGFRSMRNMVDLYYGVPRLVDKWNTPSGRNEMKYKMAGLPFVKDILIYEDNMKRVNDYMSRRGLSWEDVKYPSLMFGSQSAGRIVSDVASVARLYR